MYDNANLANLPHLKGLAPSAMHAFETFDRAAMAAGAIPRKYKELIALGVALATQCPYSLEVHRTNATNAGSTVAQIILSAGGDHITDVDAGALEGIAVTSVTGAPGTWQFSLDGGTIWSTLAPVPAERQVRALSG